MTSEKISSFELAKLCCQALVEKKADDIRILNVGSRSSITDYMIIASGNSDPHLRALRVELHRVLSDTSSRVIGVDTSTESGWTVVDLFDVMVHLFNPEARGRYKLETLWKDADQISLNKMLGLPEKKPFAKPIKKSAIKAVTKPAKPAPKKAPVKVKAKPASKAKAKVKPKAKVISKTKTKPKVKPSVKKKKR
jgi:ribosome-associated protein